LWRSAQLFVTRSFKLGSGDDSMVFKIGSWLAANIALLLLAPTLAFVYLDFNMPLFLQQLRCIYCLTGFAAGRIIAFARGGGRVDTATLSF
jgi:hypothetical protein